MPLIQVKVIEEVFSDEQKREIIERLTEAMVQVEGENMRPVTWVGSTRSEAVTGASVVGPSPPETCVLSPLEHRSADRPVA